MSFQIRLVSGAHKPLMSRETVLRRVAVVGLLSLLVACANPPHRAPVEDRSVGGKPTSTASVLPVVAAPATPEVKPMPGAENAGKPGYYTVKPGDTLIRIALDNGQPYKEVAKWNNLTNANLIEVGQVLRVVPPGASAAVSTKPINTAKVETRPLDSKPLAASSPASASTGSGSAGASGATPAASAAASASAATAAASTAGNAAASAGKPSDDDVVWGWPVPGPVVQGYEDTRNKGVDLGGKAGDAVLAAANGRVMYVGSSLRGYGNAIIVKHANDYLSVYAHNQTMLVKEDQLVHRGQKIAEMGSSDADQVKLHFEVRKSGKPLDPAKVLPPR